MTTIQFDTMEDQNTIREKRDTLQMIESIPTFLSTNNLSKPVDGTFKTNKPGRNAPNC